MWKGLIEEYKQFLPVTENTPALTLNEGNTPLIHLVNLSKKNLGLSFMEKSKGQIQQAHSKIEVWYLPLQRPLKMEANA